MLLCVVSLFKHEVVSAAHNPNDVLHPKVTSSYKEYQSINQSINQSMNQSINQSVNQSINQSINQPINQYINESMNKSINQSNCKNGHTQYKLAIKGSLTC